MSRVRLPELDPIDLIRARWPEVCGATLAQHTEPLRLVDGVLDVGVCGRDWLEAVRAERSILVRNARKHITKVRYLQLRLLPSRPVWTNDGSPQPRAIPPDPRNADIDDPELREALDALCAAWKRRAEEEPSEPAPSRSS